MKQNSEDVILAHEYSSCNKIALKSDKVCGCFYCCEIYSPDEINEYGKEYNCPPGEATALCPYCGVDSVIGESSGFPITKEFLQRMYEYWFC